MTMAGASQALLARLGGAPGAGGGIAALLLAPRLARPAGGVVRTPAKGALKGYLIVSHRTRAAVTEASEEWHKIFDEVRSEVNGASASRNGRDAAASSLLSPAAPGAEPGETREPAPEREPATSKPARTAR